MNTDFVVTAHAFERLEERFPDLIKGLSDREQATLVHGEVMDALDNGRHGKNPPIELSAKKFLPKTWIASGQPSSYYVWTRDKKRGYLLREDKEEGMLVITVIFGWPREMAKQKLMTRQRR